jgi:plasmid stabilization system protein ParE
MMDKFTIIISPQAKKDIETFYNHICYEYKQPETAAENRNGLQNRINQLSWLAAAIGTNKYVQSMFDANARHIIFKKMAIIYYLEDGCVYVDRVIASSLIH